MKKPNFTLAQKQYANSLIRLIKTAQHKLGLDDCTYRAVLQNISTEMTGVAKNSCTQMSLDELKAVADYMRDKGFQRMQGVVKTQAGQKKRKSISNGVRENEDPMIGKVRYLWVSMAQAGILRDASDQALNAFVRNMLNKKRSAKGEPLLLNLIGATRQELYILIEALKAWKERAIGE
ncbi:MAG: regulatory protein GemA [Gammaproteobacteria bacterium]|nr:regulatory protein GemA [Gammaproteobacteria bacterium]